MSPDWSVLPGSATSICFDICGQQGGSLSLLEAITTDRTPKELQMPLLGTMFTLVADGR